MQSSGGELPFVVGQSSGGPQATTVLAYIDWDSQSMCTHANFEHLIVLLILSCVSSIISSTLTQ